MIVLALRRLAAIAVAVAALAACAPRTPPAPEPQDHCIADGCTTTTTGPEVVCLATDCPEVRP